MTTINNLTKLGKYLEFETLYAEPKRGEIYQIDLADLAVGSIYIMQKARPALVIQNDIGNKFGNTVVVALMSASQKKIYPMHFHLQFNGKESTILFEQIITVDKNRLVEKLGELTREEMIVAEEKLMYSLGLNRFDLKNVKDIEVINQNITKSRKGTNINFDIDIIFENDRQRVNILLDKLKEFDNTINEDIDFDELKQKLDCCKGLNWLVTNNI